MTEKETGELRRRLKASKCAVRTVSGCFVNEKKEIVCTFAQSLGQMGTTDSEEVLSVIRKTLSGTIGKNLITLPFSTSQVMDSPEHHMLMDMRNEDEKGFAATAAFFEQAAAALQIDGNYVILVARDCYDVPAFTKDDVKADDSGEVFKYFLCAVCPVKTTKSSLGFVPGENPFRSINADLVIGAPETGFLFPSFDDRAANIYDVLYYTKNTSANHPEFIEDVLHVPVPMPADLQKETFSAILQDTLSDDCSLNVAVAVIDSMHEQIEEHKAAKEEGAPVITKKSVTSVLQKCGVAEDKVQAFELKYDESFGEAAELPPQNLVDTKSLDIATPNVSIKITADRSDLVQTRVIDGCNYILIRADSGVEVNGVSIKIK